MCKQTQNRENKSLEQWFSTFLILWPITATHYNPTNPISNSNKVNVMHHCT